MKETTQLRLLMLCIFYQLVWASWAFLVCFGIEIIYESGINRGSESVTLK